MVDVDLPYINTVLSRRYCSRSLSFPSSVPGIDPQNVVHSVSVPLSVAAVGSLPMSSLAVLGSNPNAATLAGHVTQHYEAQRVLLLLLPRISELPYIPYPAHMFPPIEKHANTLKVSSGQALLESGLPRQKFDVSTRSPVHCIQYS